MSANAGGLGEVAAGIAGGEGGFESGPTGSKRALSTASSESLITMGSWVEGTQRLPSSLSASGLGELGAASVS